MRALHLNALGREHLLMFPAFRHESGQRDSNPLGPVSPTGSLSATVRSARISRVCKEKAGAEAPAVCARYWDRTSDLFRVREARYRCANRACLRLFSCRANSVRDTGIEPVTSSVSRKRATAAPIAPALFRGGDGIRTRVYGFAGRCLASRPRHQRRPPYLANQSG